MSSRNLSSRSTRLEHRFSQLLQTCGKGQEGRRQTSTGNPQQAQRVPSQVSSHFSTLHPLVLDVQHARAKRSTKSQPRKACSPTKSVQRSAACRIMGGLSRISFPYSVYNRSRRARGKYDLIASLRRYLVLPSECYNSQRLMMALSGLNSSMKSAV